MGTWQNGQDFNQDVAKKYGTKWELGKMDRALIRMWQKSVVQMGTWKNRQGFNQGVAKKCGSKWELGKMDRALLGCGKKVWVHMLTLQKWIGL